MSGLDEVVSGHVEKGLEVHAVVAVPAKRPFSWVVTRQQGVGGRLRGTFHIPHFHCGEGLIRQATVEMWNVYALRIQRRLLAMVGGRKKHEDRGVAGLWKRRHARVCAMGGSQGSDVQSRSVYVTSAAPRE
jgi:hypothetical protein